MLNFEQVNIKYGNTYVLSNVNFSIGNTGLIGLVGPNGSGKSTFLKTIAGIIKPADGVIDIVGKDISTSFFLNETILVDNLNGFDHLSLLTDIGMQVAKGYIKIFSAEDFLEKKVKDFSLGMKQILILILTISSDAKIILLDEVLNGLDPIKKKSTIDILNEIKKEKIVFLSSHLLKDIQNNADRVFLFENNTVNEIDNTSQLEERYFNTFGDKVYEKNTEI